MTLLQGTWRHGAKGAEAKSYAQYPAPMPPSSGIRTPACRTHNNCRLSSYACKHPSGSNRLPVTGFSASLQQPRAWAMWVAALLRPCPLVPAQPARPSPPPLKSTRPHNTKLPATHPCAAMKRQKRIGRARHPSTCLPASCGLGVATPERRWRLRPGILDVGQAQQAGTETKGSCASAKQHGT